MRVRKMMSMMMIKQTDMGVILHLILHFGVFCVFFNLLLKLELWIIFCSYKGLFRNEY
jgi:hypothetical protein